jgi:hypothetical protein
LQTLKLHRLRKYTTQFSFVLWIFSAILLFANSGLAKTVFYGVGNDGYFTDVTGLETALSNLIETDTFSSYTHSNLNGADIFDSTVALKPFLAPDDTLIWYYSGHGNFFPDDVALDETRPGSVALDSYDEAIGLQGNHDWLPDDELATALNSLASSTAGILTIVDMCYAGGLVGGASDLNTVSGLTFFGSSSEMELSYFFSNDTYSLFTGSLIRGLTDWTADADGDGILMASEWFRYSYDTTVGSVESQQPIFYGEDMMITSATPAPVPLPSTIFLLASGFFTLLIRRRFENEK